MNIVVSNVPVRTCDVPGRRAHDGLRAVSIALDGIGLNVTGFSYAAALVCAVACREMMPDRPSSRSAARGVRGDLAAPTRWRRRRIRQPLPGSASGERRPAVQQSARARHDGMFALQPICCMAKNATTTLLSCVQETGSLARLH